MKKLLMLGLCLVLTTGCGRGWFPRLFRGAPCMGGCGVGAPASMPADHCGNCTGAGIGAGYESYGDAGREIVGDQVIGSGFAGERIIDGGILNVPSYNGTYSGGTVTTPSNMAPLSQPTPAR